MTPGSLSIDPEKLGSQRLETGSNVNFRQGNFLIGGSETFDAVLVADIERKMEINLSWTDTRSGDMFDIDAFSSCSMVRQASILCCSSVKM